MSDSAPSGTLATEIVEGLTVILPSGAVQPVLTPAEQAYLTDRVAKYASSLSLTNVSDLVDLDRVMVFELLIYRWGCWLGNGLDYDRDPIDDRLIHDQIKGTSTELRQIKKNVGIDRPARERAKGEGSVHQLWMNALTRAKRFGVMRCEQLDRALELTNELIGLVTVHDNATEREREDLSVTVEDLMQWLRDVYIPEFEEIDAYFREHDQSTWVREL